MKNNSGYEVKWSKDTPESVIKWLESAAKYGYRIRLFYGDTERDDFEEVHGHKPDLGKDWGEEYDVTGEVGISTGREPIPLLIHNSRSTGGGGILFDCIVRLFVNGHEVYKHPNYHSRFDSAEVKPSELAPEYSHAVVIEGSEEARFHSEKSAKNWLAFMRGERMSK